MPEESIAFFLSLSSGTFSVPTLTNKDEMSSKKQPVSQQTFSAVRRSCSVCSTGNNSINQKPLAIIAAGCLIIFPIMFHPIWRVWRLPPAGLQQETVTEGKGALRWWCVRMVMWPGNHCPGLQVRMHHHHFFKINSFKTLQALESIFQFFRHKLNSPQKKKRKSRNSVDSVCMRECVKNYFVKYCTRCRSNRLPRMGEGGVYSTVPLDKDNVLGEFRRASSRKIVCSKARFFFWEAREPL